MPSKYRGDKWNAFYSQLPAPLISHLNGNAVYNLKHPLLNVIVSKLESEIGTAGNAVPFDYRIAQVLHEAQTGSSPDFPTYDGFTVGARRIPLPEPLRADSDSFAVWMRYLGRLGELFRDTSVLANYARTNMVPDLFDRDAYIVHGAVLFDRWDHSKMGVSCPW